MAKFSNFANTSGIGGKAEFAAALRLDAILHHRAVFEMDLDPRDVAVLGAHGGDRRIVHQTATFSE
ncbi:MAG: hypothetical protein WDN48_05615 [Pseudolabrys sp.]